jgi:very-short-patch-repair endonuclease
MGLLNETVSYWYDCIKNEDILEKDISINVRSKAVLYPFSNDPFIFGRAQTQVPILENEKLTTFSEYIATQGYEAYYGYPFLFYFNNDSGKYLVAPLFIIKVKFTEHNHALYLLKDEQNPTCGIQAFSKLGFRTEEIADISQSLEKLFRSDLSDKKGLCDKCLELIRKESELPIKEPIDPTNLTNSEKLSKNATPGLYNKSLIFAGEQGNYNIHLLQDLLELKKRKDLTQTALSFIFEEITRVKGSERLPVLPFQANEYQVKAIEDIFESSLTVITGPPGTGKSQYISNLLINLFLEGKSVLFVSHTNEAVKVVNQKINGQFLNLMIQTGRKEYRQDLKNKFNQLILDSERKIPRSTSLRVVHSLWKSILRHRETSIALDDLQRKFEELYFLYDSGRKSLVQTNPFSMLYSLAKRLLILLRIRLLRIKLTKFPSRLHIEQRIRELETEYYRSSERYVKDIYVQKMLGTGRYIGRVKSFLHQVDSRRPNDDSIDSHQFMDALSILKVWSSTLKALRATFPLSAGIFDYVIFDEASQVDLPSAAPALYRAKKAIVVGDPMQLTHIAGITRDIDKGLAKIHGLAEKAQIYPSKIRYCDVSLYRSAESSLTHKPILLTNHYRSEDQIIALCNRAFYEGRLKIMTTLDYSRWPSDLPLGVNWVDCAGEVFKHPSGSRINQAEVLQVNNIFQEVLRKISGTNLSIGVVTPYSRQQDTIHEKISQSTSAELLEKHNVKILTAHKFQGSEKDIMIFSLVLAAHGTGNSDRWYNIYPQILNVALSRAKYLLYIVGDKNFCYNRDGVLNRLVETYDAIKKQEKIEEYVLHEKFDSPVERFLFQKLQEVDFEKARYKLIPKLVVKRYTLDFALLGRKKINVESDGCQHEIIEGLPVLEDIERDEFLKKEGWEILRFPNHKILSQADRVIDDIMRAL